jgi:hypothetical protein
MGLFPRRAFYAARPEASLACRLTSRHAKKRTSADGELPRYCRAMIFTRSLPIIAAPVSRSSMEIIRLGGAPHPETQAYAGPITVRFRRNACPWNVRTIRVRWHY